MIMISVFANLKVITVVFNSYIYTDIPYPNNNLPDQLLFRQDLHSYNTRNCKLINVPFHRLYK